MSKASKVRVTPKQASEWLSSRTQYEGVDMGKVNELVSAIDRGEWNPDAEAENARHQIIVKDGELMNGFHRCMAIKLSGKSVNTWVRKK